MSGSIQTVMRSVRLVLPGLVKMMKARYPLKKDSRVCPLSARVVVDFTPEGVLGDVWLCVYYFFATILPTNWGPKVFRDYCVCFPHFSVSMSRHHRSVFGLCTIHQA